MVQILNYPISIPRIIQIGNEYKAQIRLQIKNIELQLFSGYDVLHLKLCQKIKNSNNGIPEEMVESNPIENTRKVQMLIMLRRQKQDEEKAFQISKATR